MNTMLTPFRPRALALSVLTVFAFAAGPAFAAKDVVLAIGGQPDSLDPYNTNTTLTQALLKNFYQGLFGFDKDLKIQNVLAESYTVSKDGLVYDFKLRQGVSLPRRHRLQRRGGEGDAGPRGQPREQARAPHPVQPHRQGRGDRPVHGARHPQGAVCAVRSTRSRTRPRA